MGGGIVLELSFSSGTLTSIPKLSWFPRPQAYFSLWERGANGKGSAGKAVETVRVRNTLFSLQSFRSGVLDVCAHSQLFSCALVIDQSEGRQASPHPLTVPSTSQTLVGHLHPLLKFTGTLGSLLFLPVRPATTLAHAPVVSLLEILFLFLCFRLSSVSLLVFNLRNSVSSPGCLKLRAYPSLGHQLLPSAHTRFHWSSPSHLLEHSPLSLGLS